MRQHRTGIRRLTITSTLETEYKGHLLPDLIRGTLIKRYKRFLADVELDNGEVVTAHCPNSGSMKGCCEPGRPVYLSESTNPRRKLNYTWELMELPSTLIGINTQVPNRLVCNSIQAGLVPELAGYDRVVPEIKTSDGTRLDILLESDSGSRCYVEVKNCTLVEDGIARFPDAVTTRGQKHLKELERLVSQGHRGVIFYLIQRMDARHFIPAADIDPEYARNLETATRNGVEVIVRDAILDTTMIRLGTPLPWSLSGDAIRI